MKAKKRIKIVNCLIIFMSIITFVWAIYCVVASVFNSKVKENNEVEVLAYNEITFSKNGLLDLIEGDIDYVPTERLEFVNQQDVVAAYEKYIDENFLTGKVNAFGYTFVTGTGKLAGLQKTFCYVVEENMSMKNGVFNNYTCCSEVPNADGEIGGYSPNYVHNESWENGIYTMKIIEGKEDVATFSKGADGKYDVVAVNNNYNKTKTFDKPILNQFNFVLNNETIESCEIDNSSNFTITAIIKLNDLGVQIYKQDIAAFAESSQSAQFDNYQIKIVFNRYTGEIIQIYKSESYMINAAISINMVRNGVVSFKKNDE